MPFFIYTYTNIWLNWHRVDIEIDANKALPWIEIIWLPDATIKESKERIRATFRNTWIKIPPRKIIINLAPSHIKKIWTRFDVPIWVALLSLLFDPSWDLKELLENSLFFGELWLDGSIKNVNGILPSVVSAYKKWRKKFFVPRKNIHEVSCIPGIEIYWLDHFKNIIDFFEHIENVSKYKVQFKGIPKKSTHSNTLNNIKWHLHAKRWLTIAAAWMHNVLMVWPPWSWKTMLAKSLQSLLPPLNFDQVLEVSQIYSVMWQLRQKSSLILERPFRNVHHTASKISIVWWWQYLIPWEVSLAHHWILFFDELPEFPREVLEVLRQPLEDKKVHISRATWSVSYPADFMFVASMNPCKCWFFKDPQKDCICSLHDVKKYQSKISWPLFDRFDLMLEIPRENIDVILSKNNLETDSKHQELVISAREIQNNRYKETNFFTNSQIAPHLLKKYISLTSDAETFLKKVVKQLHLSPRVAHRIIKIWRTIADLKHKKTVEKSHIAEALQFRQKHMFVS